MLPPNTPNLVEVAQRLWQPWWVFVVSAAIVLVLTPLVRKLAKRWQLYDRPAGLLKPHAKPIPYLGGLAIFAAWVFPVLAWTFTSQTEFLGQILAIILGGIILMIVGLVDDLRQTKPTYRLLCQVAVAVGLFIAGVQFKAVPSITVADFTFLAKGSPEFVAAGLVIQILLIVGASNAINLLDGLDGLCSGVMVIVAVGFLLVATHIGAWAVPEWCKDLIGPKYPFNDLVIVAAMALTGAAMGFLLYNYNPATIFLGDAGSNFLGYLSAVFVILFADRPGIVKWVLAGLMIMALPIFDTGLALVRRIRNKRPIFGGDRSHFYDQLVDRGLSARASVTVCYLLAILSVAVAVWSLILRQRYMVVVYAAIAVVAGICTLLGGFIKVDPSSQNPGKDEKESPES